MSTCQFAIPHSLEWLFFYFCFLETRAPVCLTRTEWTGGIMGMMFVCRYRFARCAGMKAWIDYPAALHTRLITVCANECDFSGFRGGECLTSRYNYMNNEDPGLS